MINPYNGRLSIEKGRQPRHRRVCCSPFEPRRKRWDSISAIGIALLVLRTAQVGLGSKSRGGQTRHWRVCCSALRISSKNIPTIKATRWVAFIVGADEEIRTPKVSPTDFKSVAYAVPPHPHNGAMVQLSPLPPMRVKLLYHADAFCQFRNLRYPQAILAALTPFWAAPQ